jgi:hypothetical protein
MTAFHCHTTTPYLNRREATGVYAQQLAEAEATEGSAKLLSATQSLFRAWEQTHGFVEGAAEILLLAGWSE